MDERVTTGKERKYYKSWMDRLDKGETFKDFSLFRPKIVTMWNTSSYASGPGLEAGVDKDTLELSNDSINPPSTKTVHPRKLRKRVILGIAVGIGAIIAALVPVLLILYLPKAEPSEVVSTVEVQAKVQNKQYTEALGNKDSLEYRNFTSQFCNEIEAAFQSSEFEDTYDGCVVTELRNGSIIVIFQVVFIAKVIPTEIQVKSSLLSASKETTGTGQIFVSLGVFLLEESTVIVRTVTIIEPADNPVPKIAYGDSCKVTSSCKTDWAECSNQRCTCPASRFISHQSDSCFLMGSILGGRCSQTCSVDNAECDDGQQSVCVCSPGYYNGDGTCESKITFEDHCVEAGPADQCATYGAVCYNNKCSCVESHFHYQQNDTCLQLGSILGEACSDVCDDNNAECYQEEGPLCICNSDYYNKDGTCEQKIAFQDPCVETGPSDQCAAYDAGCKNNRCICKETHFYYQENNICLQLGSILGEACSGVCDDSNAECNQEEGPLCICNSDYYNKDGTCEQKIAFQDPCVETGPSDQCATYDAGCNNKKCSCKETHFYYQENDTCLLLGSIVGEACSDGCDDPNSMCDQDQGLICMCNVGYYNKDGTCEQALTTSASSETQTTTLITTVTPQTPTLMMSTPTSSAAMLTSSTTETITTVPSSTRLTTSSASTVKKTSAVSTKMTNTTPATTLETQTSSTTKTMPSSSTSLTLPNTTIKLDPSTSVAASSSSTSPTSSSSLTTTAKNILTTPLESTSISVSTPTTMSTPTSSPKEVTPTFLTTGRISTPSTKDMPSLLSSSTALPTSTLITTKSATMTTPTSSAKLPTPSSLTKLSTPISSTELSTPTSSTKLSTPTSSTKLSTPTSFTSMVASISSTKALTSTSFTPKSSPTPSTTITVPAETTPNMTTKLSSVSVPQTTTTKKSHTSSTISEAEMTKQISSTVMPASTTSTLTVAQTSQATTTKPKLSTTATPTTLSSRTVTSITLTSPITTMSTSPTTTPNSPYSPTSGIPPDIHLFVPGSKKLEIGNEETIACAIYNIEHVATVKLERTVGEVTEVICNLLKTGTGFDISYGDGKGSHMSVDVHMLNSDKGANVTLVFDPVQCSDSATYRCMVIARDESVDTEEKSEHVDVYKPPLLELNFPFELREGTYALNVGCRASLGYPRADLVMQRKQPGESIFTLYEPVVQKEAELRWSESNDTTNICITDVRYDFDKTLEGWNMTEFRCAINVGTETEIYSDVGVFEIVPKSVCSGKGADENVQHPFNCKLYVTCIVDTTSSSEVIWSYVKQSSCSGDECWLPTDQCGTTQSPTTTTTTTITTTTLPPGVPRIKCVLRSPLAKVGDSLHYSCNLQYVDKITRIEIPELYFQEESNAGISGYFTIDSDVSVNVSLPDGYEIGISFEKIKCNQEGDITITINNEASDTISVRIISEAEVPTLSMPENIYKNQEMTINCSGVVGRQEDGSPVATVVFQVKFNNTNIFSTYTAGTETSSVYSDSCTKIETKQLTLFPNDQWSGAKVRCLTVDYTNEVNYPSDSVGPLTLLEPDIYFDATSHIAVIGQSTSFTCFVSNVPNGESITVTRGNMSEPVITIKPSGNVEQHISNFEAVDDVDTSGLHVIRITFTCQCGDSAKYFCESSGMSTATDIYVLSKPQLTLSYEIVEGQDPWGDRPSWCEGELGSIEGSFVVEVLSSGVFVEYTEWWEKDMESAETDCGIYKKQNFVFDKDTLEFLNNKQIRCAIKTAKTFTEQELPVSEAKIIHVTPINHCDNNNWEFYEHPYDCNYYVDCTVWHAGNIHFQPCYTGTCPNRTACVASSCDGLCNRQFTVPTTTIPTTRGIDPYIDCNNTVKGEVGSDLTIYCAIGNTDDDYLTNITIYKDQSLFLDASGDQGTEETTDQTATLTYTPTTISLTLFNLECDQSTEFRFVVNNFLEDSVTVVANKEPIEPVLTLPSFPRNQRATVTCKGNLGYPDGLRDLHLEKKMAGDIVFTEITEGITDTVEFNETECAYIKSLHFAFYATNEWDDGTIKCVTNMETEVLYSQTDTISILEEQVVSFNPDQPTSEIGEPLAINCTVSGVSGLTTISVSRGELSQLICSITDAGVTNIMANTECFGELNSKEGSIQIYFSSVQCSDEGDYICEPNIEASTSTSTFLAVTRAPTSPTMTSEPKSLSENKPMLYDEKFVCEAGVGYPKAGSIILQTNRNGYFEKLTAANSESQTDTDNCRTDETVTVKSLTFDASWNNTQVRCAVEDDKGTVIKTDSKEFTIQLVPDDYCDGQDEYSNYPYDCHRYIRCVSGNVYVNDCPAQGCPVFINGTLSHCTSDRCSELCP